MPSAPVVPRASSNLRTASTPAPDVEDEDFGDGWGDMDDNDNSVADAWGAEPDTTPAASTQSTKPAMPYDDGGEPDFEGWLNAQAASKVKNNKALPKGLVKKAPVVKPVQSKPAKPMTQPSKALPAKKAQPEKKQEVVEDDDDWGEAWG
jgi:SCY1-like protein 1